MHIHCTESGSDFFCKKQKTFDSENNHPELICFANLDYFLEMFTSPPVFVKLCWEKEEKYKLTLQALRKWNSWKQFTEVLLPGADDEGEHLNEF